MTTLGKLGQEDNELEASLNYLVRSCFQKNLIKASMAADGYLRGAQGMTHSMPTVPEKTTGRRMIVKV